MHFFSKTMNHLAAVEKKKKERKQKCKVFCRLLVEKNVFLEKKKMKKKANAPKKRKMHEHGNL